MGGRGRGGGLSQVRGLLIKMLRTDSVLKLAKSELIQYCRQAFSRNCSDRSFLAFSNLNEGLNGVVAFTVNG